MRVTIRWETDPSGKKRQVYKTIGYYATKEEGLQALAEWHLSPQIAEKLTFAEIFTRYADEKFPTISRNNVNNYKNAFKICEQLHALPFAEIRLDQLQRVIDTCGKNYPTLAKIKILYNQLYDYALKHDMCRKDYSEFVRIEQYRDESKEDIHRIFITEEIHTLWDNSDRSVDVRVILILICSGLRVGELLDLKKESVDLNARIVRIKKAKTRSGVRIVPIAECVLPFWQELMSRPGDYVIPNSRDKNRKMLYTSYLTTYFTTPLEQIGITGHLPHDTRYTFVSILTSAGIVPIVIKRIVGHKSKDITERVYTHFELQQLQEAVDKPDWTDPFIGTVCVL